MNNIVEQDLTYNYDIVIVDVGDSYSGTAAYKGQSISNILKRTPLQ